MLRSLRTFATLTLHRPSPLLMRPLLPCFTFCSFNNHPFAERLLEVRTEEQLEEAMTEMAKLNENNRESAIRMIMQLIKEKVLPPRVLVNDKFTFFIKRFPIHHVQALLFRIDLQLIELARFLQKGIQQGKQTTIKDINANFTLIFQILKKIPKKDATRSEIDAYKAFADYHYKTLLRMVKPKQCKTVLAKAVDFYTSALAKLEAELQREEAKVAEEGEAPPPPVKETLEEMTPEEIELVENHISYKRQAFAEEFSQMLYSLMEAQNYLTDPRIKETVRPRSNLALPFEYHQGLFSLQTLFKQAVDHYDKVSERFRCQYYFKVKKTYLQLQHFSILHKSKDNPDFDEQDEIKAFDERMLKFTNEIINGMKTLSLDQEELRLQKSLCLLLLSIKSNKLARLQVTIQDFEQKLLEEVKIILGMIKDKDVKKFISVTFCLVIKSTMGLDFEKHLGKIPRIPHLKRTD